MSYKLMLKGIRVSRGLTQKNMANLVNMSESAYVRKENEKSHFTVNEAMRVARVLDVKLETIFLVN
ncbi:XRE family transcriptional regulator [Romboutsia weinsteinii]|uniref:XRE family transcriptional regulator n=1 Tax=Romboutsia weinsteinii TaxID=2020949 RepID=A0A371J4X4_9FIRM|nr:helix-turn-helix transcriptional regulator [Romboutsia weinsteinii]RDY27840.1 XRE family transcriptional regulator [Romboutsia weinsteinii]